MAVRYGPRTNLTTIAASAQDRIVGDRSPRFRQVLDQIDMVASRRTTVLVTGETGSGKEVAARELHRRSGRLGEMIAVNCAGVPEHLLESEFFGHEKGAFTDAGKARAGLFERADGGTLFLDEIGEMPMSLQPKLLRVLQDGCVTRLGGAAPRRIDVRLVVATNRDLWEQVSLGRFREDLYYRVNVFPIQMPALRERTEDIPELLEHFVALFCHRDCSALKRIDPVAVKALRERQWPGNVRELRNAVEQAVIQAQDEPVMRLHHFPTPRKAPGRAATSMATPNQCQPPSHGQSPMTAGATGLSGLVAHFERELIERTLEETNGNKSMAAAALKIKRTTLVEKIKRFDRGKAA